MNVINENKIRRKLNILHIYQSDYPWDVRVEKINKALVEQGQRVFLLCRNNERRKLVESLDGFTIIRIPDLKGSLHKLNSVYGYPLFFSPLWRNGTLKICKEKHIDLIIVRDLPLAMLGIWAGKKIGAPVILDMAENYPCMYEAIMQCGKFSLKNYFLKNPYLAKRIEKKVFKYIDKVLVVIEESRERLLSIGVDPQKIEIVSNTPPEYTYKQRNLPTPEEEFFKNNRNLILIYNGFTNPARGILEFVKWMPLIKEKFQNIKFIIIGEGGDDEAIKNEIQRLDMKNYVYHKGWVSHEDKLRYLKHAHVGIIPYIITSHWNTTIPNKIFDYMCMGKPILCTGVVPSTRIINECNCGLIYDQKNIYDFISKLEMFKNEEKRKYFGQNGLNMIKKKYNWDNDKKYIVKTINEVASKMRI